LSNERVKQFARDYYEGLADDSDGAELQVGIDNSAKQKKHR